MDRGVWQTYMLAYKYKYIYNNKYNDNLYLYHYRYRYGFPDGAVVKNPPANAEGATDVSSIPGLKDPLEQEMATCSSILAWKNVMDRVAGQATVHGVTKSQT